MDEREFYRRIESAKEPELSYVEVDWGQQRGQGKRSGSMVKGSMGINLRGVQRYQSVKIDVPDLDIIKQDLRRRPLHELFRYQKARNAGFNHNIAMIYAIDADKAYGTIKRLALKMN